MQAARIQVQQAYLRNCLDNALALQLDSSIQQTTPLIGGGITCVSNLAAIFKQKYPPPLLKRKQINSFPFPVFGTVIDAHLHVKAMAGGTAVVNKVFTHNNCNRNSNTKKRI